MSLEKEPEIESGRVASSTPRRSWPRVVLSLAAAGVLLGVVFWLADLDDLTRRLRSADLTMLAVSLLAYTGTYIARARRFAAVGARASTLTLISVAAIHGALNRVMPLRTGELSYPVLIRRIGASGVGEGLVQLLVLRIMDLLTVAMLFLLALCLALVLGVADLGRSTNAFVAVAVVIALACVLALARLGWFLRLTLGVARCILSLFRGALPLREKGLGLVDRASAAVTAVTELSPGRRLRIVLWSVVNWSCYFLTFHAILLALGVTLPFLRTVLGSSAAIVGSTMPISGLGTFGALEGGWTAGFVAVGLDPATAASTALIMSGVTLLFALLLAPLGWGYLSLRRPGQPEA